MSSTTLKIARHFGVNESAVMVDANSGFATSFRNQPANGWTVEVNGSAFDVWTSSSGEVLASLPV